MTEQKADELLYVTAFLAKVGVVGSPVPQPDGTGPDFVVDAPGLRVGVEVTEFWREASEGEPSRRQVEGTRDQLLRSGEQACASAGMPPLEVHVHFAGEAALSKHSVPALARELVEVVRRNMPGSGEHRSLGWDLDRPVELPSEVTGLTIIRREHPAAQRWRVVDADDVRAVSADHLQARISVKNGKASCYFAVVGEVWLLVVFDSRRMSGTFNLNSGAFEGVYESNFSRTFVFDTFSGSARELMTCSPTNAV